MSAVAAASAGPGLGRKVKKVRIAVMRLMLAHDWTLPWIAAGFMKEARHKRNSESETRPRFQHQRHHRDHNEPQITEIKTETPELLAALVTLSTFYDDDGGGGGGPSVGLGVGANGAASASGATNNAATNNNNNNNNNNTAAVAVLDRLFADPAAARTGLRSAIERRGLASAGEFLRSADRVAAALDSVDAQLAALGASCAGMCAPLQRAQRAAAPLLAEVAAAQREAAGVEHRALLVGRFLADYQLAAEEAAALRSGEVGPAFFAALERAGQVRDRCAALLRGGVRAGLLAGSGAGGAGASAGAGLESAAAAQRAGLELMDQMAAHQDAAYETLCRWVQAACRALGGDGGGGGGGGGASGGASGGPAGAADLEDADPRLAAAIAALARRPVLHRYVADEVVAARHSAVFQRLIVALTRGDGPPAGGGRYGGAGSSGGGSAGGGGGGTRPIELHAHDPRRYVADMLAWTHQALAGERELVYALFGPPGGATDDGDNAAAAAAASPALAVAAAPFDNDDGSPALAPVDPTDLLDRIFESVCRPLKARIDQVLLMSPPPPTALQIQQLLAFYHGLAARVLGSRAALSLALASLRDAARRAFLAALKAQGDRLLRAPPAPPADLAPPLAVPQALALLRELAAAFASSLAGGGAGGGAGASSRRRARQQQQQQSGANGAAAPATGGGENGGNGNGRHAGGDERSEEEDEDEDADGDFLAVVDAVVDPLLEACRRGGEVLSPHSAARLGGAAGLDPAAHPTYLANCYEGARAALAAVAAGAGGGAGGAGGGNGGASGAGGAGGGGATSDGGGGGGGWPSPPAARPPPPPAPVASAAGAKAAAVAALLAAQVDALVARETGRLLGGGTGGGMGGAGGTGGAPQLHLGEVAARLRQLLEHDPTGASAAAASAAAGPSSQDPALSPARVAAALNALFALASEPDALPEFSRLQAPRLRADAARRVAGALLDAYALAHGALETPGLLGGAGGAAQQGVRHSPADLRTVLGL